MARFGLAPPIRSATLALMKTLLPLALAAALLTGCAAIEKAERGSTESMLAAAGFNVLPANTPQRQASLADLKPYVISRQLRGGQAYYVYPDTQGGFAYIGNQAAYDRYQNLMVKQQISDQNLMAAQMASMPGMWGGWGYWGY
jgi:hypothetical protein